MRGKGAAKPGLGRLGEQRLQVSAPRLLHPTWSKLAFRRRKGWGMVSIATNCSRIRSQQFDSRPQASGLRPQTSDLHTAEQIHPLCCCRPVSKLSTASAYIVGLSIPDETLTLAHPTTPDGVLASQTQLRTKVVRGKTQLPTPSIQTSGPIRGPGGCPARGSPPPFGHTLLGDRPGRPRSLRDPQGS